MVVDAAGSVVADSDGAAARGTPFATPGRPELRVAVFRGRIDSRTRRSETLGAELLRVSVPAGD